MNQSTLKNRTENFSPTYKEYENNLKLVFEIGTYVSELLVSDKTKKNLCKSALAEEMINSIINYFNSQMQVNTNFKNNVLNEIKEFEFAYPADNEKLKSNIDVNAKNTFITSAHGMKKILNSFILFSEINSNSINTCFEDIDYLMCPTNEIHNSSLVWIEQSIDEPWYK